MDFALGLLWHGHIVREEVEVFPHLDSFQCSCIATGAEWVKVNWLKSTILLSSVYWSTLKLLEFFQKRFSPFACGIWIYNRGWQVSRLFVCLSLTSMHQDPTVVQSRVRRLIGRRRAGLDRYASILSREASQSHDYDPITELLSQLSSGEWRKGGREGEERERERERENNIDIRWFNGW